MSIRMSQFFWQNAIQKNSQENYLMTDPIYGNLNEWSNVSLSGENSSHVISHPTATQYANDASRLDPYSAAVFQGYNASCVVGDSGSYLRTDTQLDMCLDDSAKVNFTEGSKPFLESNSIRGKGYAYATSTDAMHVQNKIELETNFEPIIADASQQAQPKIVANVCENFVRNDKKEDLTSADHGSIISRSNLTPSLEKVIESKVDGSDEIKEIVDGVRVKGGQDEKTVGIDGVLDEQIIYLERFQVKENEPVVRENEPVVLKENTDDLLSGIFVKPSPSIKPRVHNTNSLYSKHESSGSDKEAVGGRIAEIEAKNFTNEGQVFTHKNMNSSDQYVNAQSGLVENIFHKKQEQMLTDFPSKTALLSKRETYESTNSIDRGNGKNEILNKTTDLGRGSVRDRYKAVRKQYPEIVRRLDRIKIETPVLQSFKIKESEMKEIGPGSCGIDADSMSGSSRTQKSSTPKETNPSKAATLVRNLNMSSIENRSHRIQNQPQAVSDFVEPERSFHKLHTYGEEFIASQRKSRFNRLFDDRVTKSEMGDMKPYRGPASHAHRQYQQSLISYGAPPVDKRFSGPYHDGRHSAAGYGSVYNLNEQSKRVNRSILRRPLSSFDAASYQRYEKFHSHASHDPYDAYDQRYIRSDDESVKSGEDESDATDGEVAQLYQEREATHKYGFVGQPGLDEFYYFGAIHLSRERVANVVHRYPPPAEYYYLPPIEKAAYIFYCALYHRHYRPVDKFHKVFNREFYIYSCEGDSPEVALWKICKHTLDEFNSKRSLEQLKAYEMSQKQLFSDDRETPDSRLSERGSREHDEESDHLSEDSNLREPLKFRVPHPFVSFSAGGKAIFIEPSMSISVVEIRDLKSFDVIDKHTFDLMESFKGPLVAGFTAPHTVRLFVQRQIESIQKSDAFKNINPTNEIKDCLLIWQLLEMVVQQSGKVTGPDLARLLMIDYELQEKNTNNYGMQANKSGESEAANEQFTKYLLGGHTDEAIDVAIKLGMYTDAMILARRVYANDPKKLEKIELQYLSHKCDQDPILTLLNVASGLQPPILTSAPLFESNNWRSHAAIILSNLNTTPAFMTIFELGCVLSRRGLNYAADFCFLAVCLLSGYNCFEDKTNQTTEETHSRTHITLIHATPPDTALNHALLSFSLMDLYATEIFEYGLRLASNGASVGLSSSVHYQNCRFRYAEFMCEYGGFPTDAFRYCVEIVRTFWDRWHLLSKKHLTKICDLADRLRYLSAANESETAWIPILQNLIDQDQKSTMGRFDKNSEFKTNETAALPKETVNTPLGIENSERAANRIQKHSSRTASLGSEAAEWHADHQDPLQMSPLPSVDFNEEIQNSIQNHIVHEERNSSILNENIKMREKEVKDLPTIVSSSVPKKQEKRTGNLDWCSGEAFNNRTQNVNEITMDRSVIENTALSTYGKASNKPNRAKVNDKVPHNVHNSMSNDALNSNPMPSVSSAHHAVQHEPQVSSTVPPATDDMANEVKKPMSKSQNMSFFGKMKATLTKAIPTKNEMILPDDSNPSIVWDDKLKKYVGGEIEDETVVPPPSLSPSLDNLNGAALVQSGGLAAARLSGGSRYFNPLIDSAQNNSTPSSISVPLVPAVPVPATFGFIPTMPDDDAAEIESPFVLPSSPELPAHLVNE